MSNVKFTYTKKRIPMMQVPPMKQPIVIGEIEEWIESQDGITVNVRLDDKMPQEIREAIEKNPSIIRVAEQLMVEGKPIILPSRPALIVSK